MPKKEQQFNTRTTGSQNYSEFKHSGGSCSITPLGDSSVNLWFFY